MSRRSLPGTIESESEAEEGSAESEEDEGDESADEFALDGVGNEEEEAQLSRAERLLRAKADARTALRPAQEASDDENEEEEEESKEKVKKKSKKRHPTQAQDGDFFEAAPVEGDDAAGVGVRFKDLALSGGMLRSLKAMGFEQPTPIQAGAIPLALAGKDVCALAKTGTGKTAAFLVPVVERLSRTRGRAGVAGRCVVLLPTRELAAQCAEVFERLAAHTRLTHVLVVGGAAPHTQQTALQGGVDFVIATPGRLLDHALNTPGVSLADVEVLVLDEADRLLELGFEAQVTQLASMCSSKERRQTLLFSATMTESVDRLAKLSLLRPVWLAVDRKYDMVSGLTHELVRLPVPTEEEIHVEESSDEEDEEDEDDSDDDESSDEEEEKKKPPKKKLTLEEKKEIKRRRVLKEIRIAALLALCRTQVKTRTLVFCSTRHDAHHTMLVLTLAGLRAADLHGDLSHAKRMAALRSFRDGEVDFLVSTDLASRGLDIEGVRAVINYQSPQTLTRYVHRVGRTARAGKSGRAITLVSDEDTELLRAVVEHAEGRVVRRRLPQEAIDDARKEIATMNSDLRDVVKAEKRDREIDEADKDATRAHNLLAHEAEIFSRPKKVWIGGSKKRQRTDGLGEDDATAVPSIAAEEEEDKDEEEAPARKRGKGENGKAVAKEKEGRRKKGGKKDWREMRTKLMAERRKAAEKKERQEAVRSARSAKRAVRHGAADPRADARRENREKKDAKKARRKTQQQHSSPNPKRAESRAKPKAHGKFHSKKRFKRR